MSKTQKHTKPNVPNLRFPGFEGEWKDTLIKKECVINPKTGDLENQFLYIDLESVVKGQLVKENVILKGSAPSRAQRVLSKWDILFQCVRPYQLNNYIVRDDYPLQRVASTGYAQIRTKNDPDFLFHLLHTKRFTEQVLNRCTGTNYPAINSSDLSSIEIRIPEIKEQTKIAKLLTLIDHRISIQNKVIEDLQAIKRAVTEHLLHLSKSSKMTLGDLTDSFSVRNKFGIKYPMYSVTNDKGFIPQSEQFEDREMKSDDISTYKLINKGDIAYNPARINVGSIAQYNNEETCMISSLYVCVRAKKHISSRWLMHVLKSKQMLFYYNQYAEGGVRLYLFYPNFSRIKINVPPYEEQIRIADVLDSIDNKIELETNMLRNLAEQKYYLLSRLFV